jgi:tetratricopeptide (TPR) repeat protein
MDEKLFETMENYVNGRMSAEEQQSFEREMSENPELREELALHRKLVSSIETESVRQMLEQIHTEHFAEETPVVTMRSRSRSFPLAIAASVALLILAGWWVYSWQSSQPEALYAAYFSPDEGLPTTLGYEEDAQFAEGMVSYKLGEYAEALDYWQPLLTADPANDTLNYYTALAFLANEQPELALSYLGRVVENETSAFATDARWYLALAYLKQDMESEAQPLLQALAAGDSPYQQESREILDKLQ